MAAATKTLLGTPNTFEPPIQRTGSIPSGQLTMSAFNIPTCPKPAKTKPMANVTNNAGISAYATRTPLITPTTIAKATPTIIDKANPTPLSTNVITKAVGTAIKATMDKSIPRPITTMAIPSPRIANTAIERIIAIRFPALKKFERVKEKITNIINEINNTIIC